MWLFSVLLNNLLCSTVKVYYSGTKSYDKKFKDEDTKGAGKTTAYTVESLVPGSEYRFELYGTSVCGKSKSRYVTKETKVEGECFKWRLNIVLIVSFYFVKYSLLSP